MNGQNYSNYKIIFLIFTTIILLAEFKGAYDLQYLPYDGFWSNNHVITRVFPDSPAEKAGFHEGDIMKFDGGIDVQDTKALSQRHPWARAGETRTYIFERDGELISLDLTFSQLPFDQILRYILYAIIGFSFLICGLWTFFKIPNKSSKLFALLGLSIGFALINEPVFETLYADKIFYTIQLLILIFGFAFLLHFLLMFPKPKAFLNKKYHLYILYSPAAIVSIYVVLIRIFQPDRTSFYNTLNNLLFLIYVSGYLILAVIVIIHSYYKSTSIEKKSLGLNLILISTIAGILPLIIVAVSPVPLPGSEFYALTSILIPIAFMVTLKRAYKNA